MTTASDTHRGRAAPRAEAAAELMTHAARMTGLVAYESPPPTTKAQIDLWLHANEGPIDAGEAWLELLAKRTIGASAVEGAGVALNRYPDASELEAMLADLHGISRDEVIVTAGGDDAIARISQVLLEPGRSLVMHDPTFVMIPHWAALAQCEVRRVPWLEGPEFPCQQVLERSDTSTAIVALVTPNNPTGGVISAADLEAIAEAARPGYVLLDHAYVEFAENDLTQRAMELGNVIVIRTFSKAGGLASLRVGYALGPAQVIRWMRAAGGPYPTSTLSLAAAAWSIGNTGAAAMRATVEATIHHREKLMSLLQELGARVLPSEANFILSSFADADRVRQALADDGIAVRGFAGHPTLGPWLRITLPTDPDDFDRLCRSFRSVDSTFFRGGSA